MNGIEDAAAALGIPPASASAEPDAQEPFETIDPLQEHATSMRVHLQRGEQPAATLDVAAQKTAIAQRRKDLRYAIAQANVERMALDRQVAEWRRELASLKAAKP